MSDHATVADWLGVNMSMWGLTMLFLPFLLAISTTLFLLAFFVASYVVPVCLVCVLHILKYRRLRSTVSVTSHNLRNMSRMICIIITLYVLLPLPYIILMILPHFIIMSMYFQTYWYIVYITLHCVMLNSSINPFVYAFMSPAFRRSLVKWCQTRRNRQQHNENIQCH